MKKKRRSNLPYKEGDWIAIPLQNGGYAVGLIARVPPGGKILLGYFFGPKRSEIPVLSDVEHYTAKDAVLIKMFGDLGLINGEWKVIGHSTSWKRDSWPVPLFVRKDDISNRYTLIEYDNDNLTEISERPCDIKEVEFLPKDGLSGYGAIEIRLTALLDQ
jgi:hypothetical protein